MTDIELRIRDSLHAEAEAWPPPIPVPVRRSRAVPRMILTTVAVAAVVLLAVGGLTWIAGSVGGSDELASFDQSSVTAPPVALARMTAVFRPGDLTAAELSEFADLTKSYEGAIGYRIVDQTAAHEKALSLFADDPTALAALNNYPDIASAFGQVEFANTHDAFAFQEAAGTVDFIVAVVGLNGPHLGAGYGTSPDLPFDDGNVRSAFWAYTYQSDLPTTIDPTSGTDDATTTTIDPNVETPATEAARQANVAIRAVPDGYFDCDTVSLSSTTTTLGKFYAREVIGRCIFDAAISGEPSQQSFYGADNAGGIDGIIVRVDGPDSKVMTTYHIDSAGNPTSTDTVCPDLAASPTSPPMCVFP